jgi:hypothetical protein
MRNRVLAGFVALAVLVPVTAVGVSQFSDVPDGKYFTDSVLWAFDNGVTTGTSDTTFSPNGPVTRGMNVTFAYRYDQNVVQPALEELSEQIANNPGPTGPQGEPGPAGPQGPQGPAAAGVVLRDGDNTYPAIMLPERFLNLNEYNNPSAMNRWAVQVNDQWWDVQIKSCHPDCHSEPSGVEVSTVSQASTILYDGPDCTGNAYLNRNWYAQGMMNVAIRGDGSAQTYTVTGPKVTMNVGSGEISPVNGSAETPGCDSGVNIVPGSSWDVWPIVFGEVVNVPVFSDEAHWDIAP